MLISQSRIVSSITWLLAGLATLVWLPRLLGTEPTAEKGQRPTASIVDITELLDDRDDAEVSIDTDDPQVNHPSEGGAAPREEVPELRLLGPLEADLTGSPAEAEAQEPPESLPNDDFPPLTLKRQPAPMPAVEEEPLDPVPHSSNRPAGPPELAVPELAVPSTPAPNGLIVPLPAAGLAVKYWVVSTRCCRQTTDRCGIACRFTCHAVTNDCQIQPVEIETLLSSLVPRAPVCIFTHGSFTNWEEVWEDADQTSRWLRSPCPQAPLNVIYFTWPSEGVFAMATNNALTTPVPNFDFAILGRRAEVNGFYLADLIGALPPDNPVSLVGHSLGARAITSGLHLLGGGAVQKQVRWNPADCGNRIRVVLAAAAIDHDWLNPGERYGCALQRAECLLSLRNGCDLALSLYPLRRPFSSRALARSGFTRKDQRRLGEHVCQVSELDVNPLLHKHHSWPYYIRCSEIAAAISPYVYFESLGQR